MKEQLNILFLSAEAVPFAKTGGLADVAGALPKAIKALGHDIRLAMPLYGFIDPAKFGLSPAYSDLLVPLDTQYEQARILEGRIGSDVPIYFVENGRYLGRPNIYGYPDDGERFIVYCRAALEAVKKLGWEPDIIHCHDWHTALVPNWLKTVYRSDQFFSKTATVYTIHNLAYQGVFGWRILEVAGIDQQGFLYSQLPELGQVVDFLGRGVIFADAVTTVSETYAREILTPEYGERLDPILRDHRDKLYGILNGIDYEMMNPQSDPHIVSHFGVEDLGVRVENKLALQREGRLPENPDVPLIGAISRLTDQKGFDLVKQAIEPLLRMGAQFVLLGTGDQYYHEVFATLAARYPHNAAVFLTFNASLAQKIYAGSDMFLMPSRFEPCGLGQMIAMRYGSVPVVRATGGLADTVQDFDPRTGEGNGFVFKHYDHMELFTALVRAIENYRYADTWQTLMRRGMTTDFSWKASAQKYVELFRRVLAAKAG